MSLHSSLKIDKSSSAQRTVITRIERIKELMKKGLWKEESSVTGLPKTKIIRVKVKKKAKEEETAAATAAGSAEGGAAAPVALAPTGAAKGGAAPKK